MAMTLQNALAKPKKNGRKQGDGPVDGGRLLEIRRIWRYIQGSEEIMSDAELLLKKVEGLPPGSMARIFEFIDQLAHPGFGMDDAEFERHKAHCPLNVENPPFNAVTLAAIAEGDAMMRGEIPGKWHRPKSSSREDILASIREAMED
jgi:hypothetical protein